MKSVLVTGGSRRLGRAICEEFAAQGYRVIVHANESMDKARALAEALGGVAVQCDLLATETIEPFYEQVAKKHGPIDVLVNNAGEFPVDTIYDGSTELVDRMMRLHFHAPLRLTRMHAKHGGSSVVNILDTRNERHDPNHFSYIVSKRALRDLTPSLAIEFAPMRVNGVSPGAIIQATDGSSLDAAVQATVLKTYGKPEDVALAVRQVAEATYSTGDNFRVDGGRHLRG